MWAIWFLRFTAQQQDNRANTSTTNSNEFVQLLPLENLVADDWDLYKIKCNLAMNFIVRVRPCTIA